MVIFRKWTLEYAKDVLIGTWPFQLTTNTLLFYSTMNLRVPHSFYFDSKILKMSERSEIRKQAYTYFAFLNDAVASVLVWLFFILTIRLIKLRQFFFGNQCSYPLQRNKKKKHNTKTKTKSSLKRQPAGEQRQYLSMNGFRFYDRWVALFSRFWLALFTCCLDKLIYKIASTSAYQNAWDLRK